MRIDDEEVIDVRRLFTNQPAWFAVGAGGMIASGLAVAVARGSTGHRFLFGAVLVVLLVIVLAGLARIAFQLAGVDPDAERIAGQLASGNQARRLLARWLNRTRLARNVGGYAGATWWILGTWMHGDLLLYGVGGLAAGSIAAQLHHVRRRSGPRTAALTRRSTGDYLERADSRRMLVTAVASAAVAATGAVRASTRATVPWAVGALAVLGATHLVQRRVAARARPALTAELQQADDLARELAIGRGLAQPAVYVALVLVAHGAAHLRPSLGGAATLVSVASWLYALRTWWRNRRLGLDALLAEPATVAA